MDGKDDASPASGEEAYGYRFSFPLGVPIVFYTVFALVAFSDRWFSQWFAVAAVLLAALFTWEAFSRKEFETIRAKDPTMNIETWVFNWFVFCALPGYVIGIVAAVRAY